MRGAFFIEHPWVGWPFFIAIIAIFWLVGVYNDWDKTAKNKRFKRFGVRLGRYAKSLLLIFIIGYLLVWPVYQFHVANYPPERQVSDTAQILSSHPFPPAAKVTIWMADKPVLRPYAQYMLGLLMVFQRTAGGNTTYFLGDVSSTAWKSYFPTVFALKVPVALLALIVIALGTALARFWRAKKYNLKALAAWIRDNFAEFTFISFILFYWFTSIFGNLNIGLRHVLPTFPFIYLLIVWQTKKWLNPAKISRKPFRMFLMLVIVLWYFVVSVLTFPFYISYFNETIGGSINGYKYVADSNLDWGQDLKRLAEYVEENNIEIIKVDYFGGDSPPLRLGGAYRPLDSSVPNQKGWLAISGTLLQNGRGVATKGFDQSTTHYRWLDQHEPVARIGFSIFVYNIE